MATVGVPNQGSDRVATERMAVVAQRRPEPTRWPSLSVIIPCWNSVLELGEQLRALADQSYPGWWELIIADNGSTDGTRELAASFGAWIPGLRVVDAGLRRGKPFAVNTAVRSVRGEALILLDSDDVIAEGYLEAMGLALIEHQVVGARLDSTSLNAAWIRSRREPLQDKGLQVALNHRPFVIGAGLGVRTTAFREVGGFDERMERQEDIDLCWRLQDAGYPPAFVPDAVVRYRYRQDLAAIWRQELAYGEYEALLYAKHRASGVSRRPLRRTVRDWLEIPRMLPLLGSAGGRARMITFLAAAIGRLRGSLRARVLYL